MEGLTSLLYTVCFSCGLFIWSLCLMNRRVLIGSLVMLVVSDVQVPV